jgi:leucyl-tRNA synthetase
VLKVAHPLIPFITEVLWKEFAGDTPELLINQPWPDPTISSIDTTDAEEMGWVVQVIDGIRSHHNSLALYGFMRPHQNKTAIKVNGKFFILWGTIDSDGYELVLLLQKHRNKKAAIWTASFGAVVGS